MEDLPDLFDPVLNQIHLQRLQAEMREYLGKMDEREQQRDKELDLNQNNTESREVLSTPAGVDTDEVNASYEQFDNKSHSISGGFHPQSGDSFSLFDRGKGDVLLSVSHDKLTLKFVPRYGYDSDLGFLPSNSFLCGPDTEFLVERNLFVQMPRSVAGNLDDGGVCSYLSFVYKLFDLGGYVVTSSIIYEQLIFQLNLNRGSQLDCGCVEFLFRLHVYDAEVHQGQHLFVNMPDRFRILSILLMSVLGIAKVPQLCVKILLVENVCLQLKFSQDHQLLMVTTSYISFNLTDDVFDPGEELKLTKECPYIALANRFCFNMSTSGLFVLRVCSNSMIYDVLAEEHMKEMYDTIDGTSLTPPWTENVGTRKGEDNLPWLDWCFHFIKIHGSKETVQLLDALPNHIVWSLDTYADTVLWQLYLVFPTATVIFDETSIGGIVDTVDVLIIHLQKCEYTLPFLLLMSSHRSPLIYGSFLYSSFRTPTLAVCVTVFICFDSCLWYESDWFFSALLFCMSPKRGVTCAAWKLFGKTPPWKTLHWTRVPTLLMLMYYLRWDCKWYCKGLWSIKTASWTILICVAVEYKLVQIFAAQNYMIRELQGLYMLPSISIMSLPVHREGVGANIHEVRVLHMLLSVTVWDQVHSELLSFPRALQLVFSWRWQFEANGAAVSNCVLVQVHVLMEICNGSASNSFLVAASSPTSLAATTGVIPMHTDIIVQLKDGAPNFSSGLLPCYIQANTAASRGAYSSDSPAVVLTFILLSVFPIGLEQLKLTDGLGSILSAVKGVLIPHQLALRRQLRTSCTHLESGVPILRRLAAQIFILEDKDNLKGSVLSCTRLERGVPISCRELKVVVVSLIISAFISFSRWSRCEHVDFDKPLDIGQCFLSLYMQRVVMEKLKK